MSESAVKRIVIACDAQCDIDAAVREAAELAGRWRVPLHGIFLLDENLLRLAELPFGREVRLSAPEVSGTLEPAELHRLFSVFAASMRRTIEAAAEQEGVAWSFTEVNDLSGNAATEEGDILVIDVGVRPFSGAWRPRSLREHGLADFETTVLLRRNEPGQNPCVLLILSKSGGDHDRLFAALRPLIRVRDRLVVLIPHGPRSEGDLHQFLMEPNVSTEEVDLELAPLQERIATLKPRLLALETSALDRAELSSLIADSQCDLLLFGTN
jgi:hypothetical protein